MNTQLYIFLSSLLLTFLGIIWNKKEWLNALVKFVFVVIGVWGLVLFFKF